ncbi:AIPR family protein [Arthrobacter sp. MYb222]|uniref:AIPR family protein n=1 Tax=Arthrobacter sp. MYb222 TaxID=1848599 RepID=UPI001C612055|nr:AIPR family protein [Arthrobacter sp. MYb222]
MKETDAFELFVATLVFSDDILDQQKLSDFLLDESTIGIDLAVLEINGQIIGNISDVDEMCLNKKNLDVTLHFVQAKTSSSVKTSEILNFGNSVKKVLENNVSDNYPKIKTLARSLNHLLTKYATRLKALPQVNCTFVSTANNAAVQDEIVIDRAKDVKKQLDDFSFISPVSFEVFGSSNLYEASRQKNHSNESDVALAKADNLPSMPGIDQAIIGAMSLAELLKLVKNQDGTLNERVFYQNVRGFKGTKNPVNEQIIETLKNEDRSLLPVLNNGVTIVAREYSPKPGDVVTLSGYQVVNGCQTSHCIYESEEDLAPYLDTTYIPFRIVVTNDEGVATKIIRATNSQTEVEKSDLVALSLFQKRLEDYYQQDPFKLGLTYERRSGQFYYREVTRTRTVTITEQMRSFSAMFLDNPHDAGRYPKALYAEVGSTIFNEDHQFSSYMASAYVAYRLETAFRSTLDTSFKPLRYQILMAYKYMTLGGRGQQLNGLGIDKQSEKLIKDISTNDYIRKFKRIAHMVLEIFGGQIPTADRLKRQAHTKELVSGIHQRLNNHQ